MVWNPQDMQKGYDYWSVYKYGSNQEGHGLMLVNVL